MTHIFELDAYELHLEDGQVFNDLMNARVLHNMNDRVDYYSKYNYIFMLIIIYEFFLKINTLSFVFVSLKVYVNCLILPKSLEHRGFVEYFGNTRGS